MLSSDPRTYVDLRPEFRGSGVLLTYVGGFVHEKLGDRDAQVVA